MLLVYDGECGFCIRSARWIGSHLPADARVEPWQSLDLDELGLTRQEAEAAVWWLEAAPAGTRRCRGAEAIGRALIATGGAWRVTGWLVVHPPVCWLARAVYALVAANRHRLPGI